MTSAGIYQAPPYHQRIYIVLVDRGQSGRAAVPHLTQNQVDPDDEERNWVARRALLPGLPDVLGPREKTAGPTGWPATRSAERGRPGVSDCRAFEWGVRTAIPKAWLVSRSTERGRPSVLDILNGRGLEWEAKAAMPKAWLITRSTERGRSVVLDCRTRSAEREGTEGVLNEVRLLGGQFGLRLEAPAEALLLLLVCCTWRSIHIDGPSAVGH